MSLDKIKEGLKKVISDIREDYDDKHFVDEDPNPVQHDEGIPNVEEDDYDPYEVGTWGNNWFCIRCGHQLDQIAKDDKNWGKWCWDAMKRDGTTWYLCSNKGCCHHGAPLILHHPIYGYTAPAGDSYSISWVK